MNIIKKTISILISTLIFIAPLSVFAQTEQPTSQPISDKVIDTQLKKAINQGTQPVSYAELKNEDTGLTYNVNVYELTLDNNQVYTSNRNNAKSVCYVASTDYMELDQTTVPISQKAGGSISDADWDSTGSVRLTLGFDYNRNTSNQMQLTYVWGSPALTSGVSLKYSLITPYQASPGTGVEYRNWNYYSSFGQHTGFTTWVNDSDTTDLLVTWTTTLNRGDSSWQFRFRVVKSEWL